MTAPIPAELIAERFYSHRYTARILCPYCQRTHSHLWPTNIDDPLIAHCGAGLYAIATA